MNIIGRRKKEEEEEIDFKFKRISCICMIRNN